MYPQGCAGSIPAFGTKENPYFIRVFFLDSSQLIIKSAAKNLIRMPKARSDYIE